MRRKRRTEKREMEKKKKKKAKNIRAKAPKEIEISCATHVTQHFADNETRQMKRNAQYMFLENFLPPVRNSPSSQHADRLPRYCLYGLNLLPAAASFAYPI